MPSPWTSEDEGVEPIVLGRRGLGGLKGLPRGSVGHKVARAATSAKAPHRLVSGGARH